MYFWRFTRDWTKLSQLKWKDERMTTVNIHAAKTHLSRLVEQASAGEEIIIAKAGTPAAKLGPLAPLGRKPRASRVKKSG